MKNKNTLGGGVNKASTTSLRSFVALGLSSLLPSLAFSSEGNEALSQLLITAPKAPSGSKTQKMESYSPVVDLRSRSATPSNSWLFGNQTFTQNTVLDLYFPNGTKDLLDSGIGTVFNTNSTLTLNITADRLIYGIQGEYGVLAMAEYYLHFTGSGTYNLNVTVNSTDYNNIFGFLGIYDRSSPNPFNIDVQSNFIFKASGNVGSFIGMPFGQEDVYGTGSYRFNAPYLEIDMNNDGKNKNTQQYVIYSNTSADGNGFGKSSAPSFYLNANSDMPTQANSQSSVVKLTGNLLFTNAKTYAYFTNSQSFLKGNLELKYGKSIFSFSNESSMTGNIKITGNGNHSITFDNANFIGQVQGANSNSNTVVTFKNTASRTFGNGTDDIVDSSYQGAITGSFDVSANSTTIINGGTDGSKGFFGSGTNTLVFDFKGNAGSNISANQSFSIGGGNASSIYAISGFSDLNFTTLSESSSIYNALQNAGIKIAVDTQSDTTNNHLNGTLFFQKTNMTVGDNGNALFADQTKIVGADKDLNGLALGAMFGNATWNDANNDGYITSNEITANAGNTNYRLSSASALINDDNVDNNTSTGNIGNTNDQVKKQVGFIFSSGTYEFGGEKQGYSGIINGGTSDSKYYFANAGYITRTQISNALGDLVLFNTAFRGDLGVNNDNVSIMLDFSNGRNGLRSEQGDSYANIVGAGSKNITFNFTGNTQAVKYAGAVVGDVTKTDATESNTDTDTATYTMLNLKKYSSDDTPDGDGSLKITESTRAGSGSKTLIDAIQEAGLTNFNKPLDDWGSSGYPNDSGNTDVSTFSTTATTLALRGTSLDASNIDFSNYIYDFVFGSGIGEIEGVSIQDSKLNGIITLTGNNNVGHSFVFKGTAIKGTESGVLAQDGKLAGFSYDDSTAEYESAVTFKLSGLTQANYVTTSGNAVTGDSLIFTQTNLEGNLWADNSVALNLNFSDGNTWKMDSSGFYLASGSNIVIHGKVENLTDTPSEAPKLQLYTQTNQGKIELINTGVNLVWNLGNVSSWSSRLGESFDLRGTSLGDVTYSGSVGTGTSNRFHGSVDSGYFNLVFAKGTNLQTTVLKEQDGSDYANITDKEADTGYLDGEQLNHTGSYENGVYDGNYIAESSGKVSGFNVNAGFNLVFIGENAWDTSSIASNNFFKKDSTLTLVNSSNSSAFDAANIGNFFKRSGNDISATATITIEGTSISNGNSIVGRTNAGQQALLNFNMTFVKGDSGTYISDLTTQYADLSTTTNANGALSDSVLKIAQSSLNSGINFQNSNFNVLFVGDGSQSLSNSNIFQGGSATSIVTFRDSNLNAGNGTSSIQNIAGTIAFDLSHNDEDMEISGTLSNMLASGGKHQVRFKNTNNEVASIDRLVFMNVNDIANSTSLSTLSNSGNYFSDIDTFGSLAQADYSDLALLTNVDTSSSSSLTFADNATVALTSGEVLFVGENSHKFDVDDTSANKLGNSTGGTLTFVDAGELLIDNLLNISGSTQQGKGTINLIGNTRIETQSITPSDPSKKTLTFYRSSADNGDNGAITGSGITINAVFTGENALADDNNQTITTSLAGKNQSTITGASTYDIGQSGEETTYHILFDYSNSNLTFGEHHAYQGNIKGLTSESIIKFKNAGYINGTQIENTDATIYLDNTQLKSDFKGDNAVLDFRNGRSAIGGNILTSDTANTNLSRKILTFDLTNTTETKLNYTYNIQAGYKVATEYTEDGQSILTFQNAPAMTLGNDNNVARGTNDNPSDFIKSLANDVGFSGIGSAKTTDADFTSNSSASYILQGTQLAFQGTNITADSSKTITENTYSLDLSFDVSKNRESTGLGETLNSSTLTANNIIMGELSDDGNNPLSLSLSFKDKGSLVADNSILNVKLKDNAIFNLNAESSNGNIGTLVLSENTGRARTRIATDALALSAQSSMNIQAGSMNFVGVFDTSSDSTTDSSNYGTLNLAFDGVNKAYGLIAHKGNTSITLTGNALFSEDEALTLGFEKSENQFADLVIDASVVDSGKTLSLNLAHTSGMVGIIGKNITYNGATSQSSLANLNLSNVSGKVALKGAFDLGNTQNSFTQNNQLAFAGDTYLKLSNGASLTLTENGTSLIASEQAPNTPTNLYIDALGSSNGQAINLTLTNLDPNIQVKLINNIPSGNMWGYNGTWDIRGTNINLDKVFWAEKSDNTIKMVFAKGEGRETTVANTVNNGYLKLSELTTNDKINESVLTGTLAANTLSNGNYHQNGDGSSLLLKNASLTFIGKESLGVSEANQRIDGSYNSGGTFKIGLYNTILKSGSILLDSSVLTNNASRSISDQATIAGTDTFNLSVSKVTVPTNASGLSTAANNSTINAVYVNGTTTTNETGASITGVRYIDSSYGNTAFQTTLSEYAVSNAGGSLSETQLKTLESKAYGNIAMDNTVTATMKFIGENSHSFDGKTAVYQGADNTYGTSDDEFYYSSNASSTTPTDWQKITINENGIVTLSNDNLNSISGVSTSNIALATLSGGNANSRFDFDHTSVSLDLIKNAGGKTYVYNSNVIGNIAVSGLSNSYDSDAKPNEITPSTTLFFNAVMGENGQELTNTAQAFIDSQFRDNLGINLDLSTARALNDSHLTNGIDDTTKKLGATTKQTNLVLIGKGSVTANSANGNGDAIDLSFLPDTSNSANYAYTIISGGLIEATTLANAGNDYEMDATIFGNSKVQLVDTYVTGERNFAQVGFINTNLTYNQKSSWGGDEQIEQFLIFDMGGSNANTLNQGGSADVITNESSSSHYIFSNLNTTEPIEFTTNIKTTLNNAMSNVAPGSNNVIGDSVKGTLGLRGVSVKGDISDSGSNGIDIVFNSTSHTDANQGIAYKEWFNSDGSYQSAIVSGEKNLVSHGTDYTTDPNISGYAVLMSSNEETKEVSISGTATKTITFIGDRAINGEVGGFDKLKIEGGSADSNYTFHTVGELSKTFLKNVGLQGDATKTNPQATAGNFTFTNSTITGDINVDQNSTDSSNTNVLTFDNVDYSGTISGNLKKNLLFGANTNNVVIIGGSEASVYDFSNLSGSSINLSIDMSNGGAVGSTTYTAPTITGFDGDVSLIGSLKLAKTARETNTSSDYSNSFAFNDNASWRVTDSSRVMNLSLSNTGINYNLDLASASRASNDANSNTQESESVINQDLRVLEVGNLTSNNGQVLLGTVIDTQTQSNSQSDKIKASVINSGTLYVTAQDATLKTGRFETDGENAIVLVTADYVYGEVQGAQRKQGLSYITTSLEHQVSNDNGSNWSEATEDNTTSSSHRWVLSGFDTKVNQELVDESGFIVSNPYRMLMIETNNLNKRMGDLRDDDYNQGAWIRVFNGSDSGEGAKNLYTNIQLGYDYGTPAIGAKNYTGVAFSTSIVDIDGNQYSGKANTYSLAAYNAYIADSGLYVDTIAKYLYTDQKITPAESSDSSFGSHALSLGLEVGYRAYMGETNFYIEPQAEAIGGIIFGVKDINMGMIGGMSVTGELKTTTTINTRVGLVQGYSLKTQSGFRADFRLGVSLVNEFVSESDPVRLYDGITEASTSIGNDVKAVINIGTNLILTDQWRVYIDAERSFGGARNVDYQANVGARFSFGEKISSLPKPEKPLPLKLKSEEKKEQDKATISNTQEVKN